MIFPCEELLADSDFPSRLRYLRVYYLFTSLLVRLGSDIQLDVRCDMRDAQMAVETGVDGLDIVFGTSSFLRKHSHGKDMDFIIKSAQEVVAFVKSKGLEVRFSSEDSFRSDWDDLVALYTAMDKAGVNRVGIADTVGCANPRQVFDVSHQTYLLALFRFLLSEGSILASMLTIIKASFQVKELGLYVPPSSCTISETLI